VQAKSPTSKRSRKDGIAEFRAPDILFPNLVDSLRDVVYVLAANGTLVWLSRAFETVTGWPRTAWQHRPFSDLLHADDIEKARTSFARTLRGEVPPLIEFRVRKASGHYVTVELLARPLEHEGRHAEHHPCAPEGV